MTTLYVDVSHHDWSRRGGQLDWARIRAATSPVMVARATYGDPSGWSRPSYHHADFHRGAKAEGFDVRGSYGNFIRGDAASIARQVDWLRREMDTAGAIWAMADIERYPEMMTAGVFPRWEDVRRLNDRWYSVEDRVMAWYLPKWVWERSDMGRPDLRYLRGPLVSSRYPLSYTQDDPAGLYARCGGDTGSGWAVYSRDGKSGYVRPALWQFTSSALVPGTTGGADCNAYQGSLAQLRTLLTGQTKEDDVTPEDINAIAEATAKKVLGSPAASWMPDSVTTGGSIYEIHGRTKAMYAQLATLIGKDFTDEPAIIAGVLAGLTPEAIAAAIPTDLAQRVADELASRLSG